MVRVDLSFEGVNGPNDPKIAQALKNILPRVLEMSSTVPVGQGNLLFPGQPGKLFNAGNGTFVYNSGLNSNGNFLPSFFMNNGNIGQIPVGQFNGNLNFNTNDIFNTSVNELGLIRNGNTFVRSGFPNANFVQGPFGFFQFGPGSFFNNGGNRINFSAGTTYFPHAFWGGGGGGGGGYWGGGGGGGWGAWGGGGGGSWGGGGGGGGFWFNPFNYGTRSYSSSTDSFSRRPIYDTGERIRIDGTGVPRKVYSGDPVIRPASGRINNSSSLISSHHPADLHPLIGAIRGYYSAVNHTGPVDPTRPNNAYHAKSALPVGFSSLLSRSGTIYHSQFPSYAFINSGGKIYYKHRDSSPYYWKSTASGDDDKVFKLEGGNGSAGNPGYMTQVSGSSTYTAGVSSSPYASSLVDSRPNSSGAIINDVPSRLGNPLGFKPSTEKPLKSMDFDTDFSGMSFTTEINGKKKEFKFNFKPSTGTSKDFLEGDRGAIDRKLREAGVKITPIFDKQENPRSTGGTWSSYKISGYRVEFYKPGNFNTKTIPNFYSWYSTDGGRRKSRSDIEEGLNTTLP